MCLQPFNVVYFLTANKTTKTIVKSTDMLSKRQTSKYNEEIKQGTLVPPSSPIVEIGSIYQEYSYPHIPLLPSIQLGAAGQMHGIPLYLGKGLQKTTFLQALVVSS